MRTDVSGIRQALAAYSCGGSRGMALSALQTLDVYHIPSSLSREREAIKLSSTTLRPHIVNGDLAASHRPERPCVAGCRPCINLRDVVRCSKPTDWGWRVKRESGEMCINGINPGTAPATVSESKAKLKMSLRRLAREDVSPAPRRSRVRRPARLPTDTLAVGELGYVLGRRRQSDWHTPTEAGPDAGASFAPKFPQFL